MDDIINAYYQVEKMYNGLIMRLEEVDRIHTQWFSINEEVRKLLEQKNKLRNIYIHYEEKYDKMISDSQIRAEKGKSESKKGIEALERVK
jgi:hypothetical protein